MDMNEYAIRPLPFPEDLETKEILKKLAKARAALAELKGVAESIPNQTILINTLTLQEAKLSSAIENIITTHDELFRVDASMNEVTSKEAKEVLQYRQALVNGFDTVKKSGIIRDRDIHHIQSILVGSETGYRKQLGTVLKNAATQEIVYTPPQNHQQILDLMANLVDFANDETLCAWDPLVKMAVIHHQFESIHPFYDGNGRTGRILNVLYLVKEELLHIPILYLSRYINQFKADYYRLLQSVRTDSTWEEWVIFMLDAVEQTARYTIRQIREIKSAMMAHKQKMRAEIPKVYSQDLLNNIFRHPYTKISFLESDLSVTRITATRYLNELIRIGILQVHRIGRENYYINTDLFRLLESGVDFEFQAPSRLA
jgi:Fic family protein